MPRLARENTLASFALALESGADGIELDVHATWDGVVVVNHDAALQSGADIASLTLAQLMAAGGTQEQVPTLREVCAWLRGAVELFVEIKGANIDGEVEKALHGYDGRVAIHSFDHGLIGRLAERSAFRLGILIERRDVPVAEAMSAAGATDVWPHYPIVDQRLVDTVHAAGGRVIPWTVNEPAQVRQLTLTGVDGLCGDDVRIFAAR
ncbi:MAG: hypothetical protein JWM95_5273 [Gemmatimonadetes bacterium]|nr:hypothetical protein [Gemmatimonadota bacterium]